MTFCKRNISDSIALYKSYKSLPVAWDSLIPANHFLSREQLATTENSGIPDVNFIYAIAYKDAQPVAVAYLQLLSLSDKHLDSSQLSAWQRAAWQSIRIIARPKLLVAGHLFRHDICSFYWDNSITPYDAFLLYKDIIDATVADTCAHAVLIKDMPSDLGVYFQHHAPQYLLLRNDISMELDIPDSWNNIGDYEKALKHKYAQRFRKIRQSFAHVSIKKLTAEQVNENAEHLYQLYRQVSDKQKARLGFLSPAFLPALKRLHADSLKVWGIYDGDTMVGFLSAWVRDDVFDMFYVGFDYEKNTELQLYFNILFFSIEQAIAYRKKKLILGRTALDAKARLGCKPNYLNTFLYIRNSLVRNRVLLYQHNSSAQEGAWEERHPFKPSASSKN